jgi:allantoin racemase
MLRIAFVIGGYPPEEYQRRADVARSYSTPEIDVGIVDTQASPYFYGMTPTEIQLVAPAYIESFRQAEKEGYDAVVPLGMLDLGVDGGKSAVDIPVVGPMEAALHIACLLGDRFGLIIYHEKLLAFNRAIVRRYGMEERIVGFGVSGFDLPDLTAHRDQVVQNLVSEGKKLVANGAEVIIPMGISQCPVHIKPDWLQAQLGVPVVEGIGAPIRMAAMLAGLGLKQSRLRWPKSRSAGNIAKS